MTSLWNTLCLSICPCQWIRGDPHTNVLNSFIILWAFFRPFDKMFRAITPVVAIVPVKLLPGVRVNFSWTPVLLTRMLRAVLKPHPIAEEWNLACVIRIWYNRFFKCVLLSTITEKQARYFYHEPVDHFNYSQKQSNQSFMGMLQKKSTERLSIKQRVTEFGNIDFIAKLAIICRNDQMKFSWVCCKRTQWTMFDGGRAQKVY